MHYTESQVFCTHYQCSEVEYGLVALNSRSFIKHDKQYILAKNRNHQHIYSPKFKYYLYF